MGEYFLIVNPVKRQYVSASPFGENIKRNGIFAGHHGYAIGLLLCNDPENFFDAHPLVGSWAGDPIIVAGDYSAPDTLGIPTTLPDDPGRNLYHMAEEEFEDISHRVMIMLFDEYKRYKDSLNEFLYNAMWVPCLFDALKEIVLSLEYIPLREALEKSIGPHWLELYPKIHEIRDLCFTLLLRTPWLLKQEREGIPMFRVGRKIFAKLRQVNGRWALLCKVRPETLKQLVGSNSGFFALPDTHNQGWIGTWIDGSIDWKEVAEILAESFRLIAPKRILTADIWNAIIHEIDEHIQLMETQEEQ